jgi:predicted translin family RNA/ssDNA-binding protein
MKAEEIFEAGVKIMKEVVTSSGMTSSIQRARNRTEEENLSLLVKQRENVNELVRKIAEGQDMELMKNAQTELVDAMVLRYLKNRDVFMKTFPDGIEDVSPDPLLLWAAIMISPEDDTPILWS